MSIFTTWMWYALPQVILPWLALWLFHRNRLARGTISKIRHFQFAVSYWIFLTVYYAMKGAPAEGSAFANLQGVIFMVSAGAAAYGAVSWLLAWSRKKPS